MNSYTQFAYNTRERFAAANENHDANLLHNDIYNDLLQEFYAKYELPALHHEGDGFNQGDAIDEDFDTLFERIKEVHLSDYSNEISSMSREEVTNDDILDFLDKEFMSIEEEAYDSVLAKYEDETFHELKEKYEVEVAGTSIYVIAEDVDNEDFVQEAEELLTLMQTYKELLHFEFEFVEIEEFEKRATFHYNAEEIIKYYCGNVDVVAKTDVIVTVDCGLHSQDDDHEIATLLLKYDINELALIQEDYEDAFDKDANNKHFYKKAN